MEGSGVHGFRARTASGLFHAFGPAQAAPAPKTLLSRVTLCKLGPPARPLGLLAPSSFFLRVGFALRAS
jgi:hypothetical protein